jgi:mRNA-degrading endonuclease toxin of MazEF toxin-antitoxin module
MLQDAQHRGRAWELEGRPAVVSDSSIHCDELVSLPKSSLTHHLGLLGPKKTDEVNRALRIALELEKDALLYK